MTSERCFWDTAVTKDGQTGANETPLKHDSLCLDALGPVRVIQNVYCAQELNLGL